MRLRTPGNTRLIGRQLGFTDRDAILAILLALQETWLSLTNCSEWSESDRNEKWHAGKELTYQLLHVLRDRFPCIEATVSEVGYGIPRWMFSEGSTAAEVCKSPLVKLENDLLDPDSIDDPDLKSAIGEICRELTEYFGDDQELGEGLGAGAYLYRLHLALLEYVPTFDDVLGRSLRHSSDGQLAARTDSGGIADHTAGASREHEHIALNDDSSSRGYEIDCREKRFDIPLCSKNGKQTFLLGARLILDSTIDEHVTIRGIQEIKDLFPALEYLIPEWRPADDKFECGVKTGIAAACKQLSNLGLPCSRYKHAKVVLHGLLPPWSVEGDSVALPVALEVLRHALDLPRARRAASGAISQRNDGSMVLRALSASVLEAKAKAVVEDQYCENLVAVVASGECPPNDVIELKETATIVDAGNAMWEKAFDERMQHCRREWLRQRGFSMGWQGGPFGDQYAIRVSSERAEVLFNAFGYCGDTEVSPTGDLDGSQPRVIFLGGPSLSGKTFIAQEVAKRLIDECSWEVAVLDVIDPSEASNTLTSRSVLRELIVQERELLDRDQHRLIIIDGLEYSDGLNSLDSVLNKMAAEFGIWFLVVRRSDNTTEWSEGDHEYSFSSIVSREHITNFAERLASRDDIAPGSREKILRPDGAFDLIWLIDLAKGEDPNNRLEALTKGEKTIDEIELLRRLAYASAWGVRTPLPKDQKRIQHLQDVLGYRLLDSSGCRSGTGREKADTGLLIRSRIFAQKLANALTPDGTYQHPGVSHADSVGVISEILREHIDDHEPAQDRNIDAALALCRTLSTNDRSGVVASSVIGPMSEQIVRVVDGKSLDTTFKLLAATGMFLREHFLVWLLAKMLQHALNFLEEGRLTVTDLQKLVGFVDRYWGLLFINNEHSQAAEHTWTVISEKLQSRLTAILSREANEDERLQLIRTLLDRRNGVLDSAVAHAIGDLKSVPMVQGEVDFFAIIQWLDVAHRLQGVHEARQDGDLAAHARDWAMKIIAPLSHTDVPQRMLPLCMFQRLRLRLRCIEHEWEKEFDRLHKSFSTGLATAPMRDVIQGLNGIFDENPAFVIHYLNVKKPFGAHFVNSQRHSAGDFADFLGALSRWHGSAAFELLYYRSRLAPDSMAVPHVGTASALVDRIRTGKDGRNAGRVIMAAAKIDDLFRTHDASFALLLIEKLTPEFFHEQFRNENRTSILYYLATGLYEVDSPVLDNAVDDLVPHLREAIHRGSIWSARLVHKLCVDGDQRFRKRMLDLISDGIAAATSSLFHTRDPDTATALLRLLCLVDSGFEESSVHWQAFLAEFEKPSALEQMITLHARSGRPIASVQALRAVQTILRRTTTGRGWLRYLETTADDCLFPRGLSSSDFPARVAGLRRHRGGGMRSWRLRCLEQIKPEDTGALLDELRHFDPIRARELLNRDAVINHDPRNPGILGDKVRRLRRSPLDVVRLLDSADKISPGSGERLLSIYLADDYCSRVLRDEVQFIQNPRTLARVYRGLLKFGYPSVKVLENTYDTVWRHRISVIRSPAVLSDLLALEGAFDAHVGTRSNGTQGSTLLSEAASRLSRRSIEQRLARCSRSDLRSFPALIKQLIKGDQRDFARKLAEGVLKADLVKVSGPKQWAETFRVCLTLDIQVPKTLIDTADRTALNSTEFVGILDDIAVWEDLWDYAEIRAKMAETELTLGRFAVLDRPAAIDWHLDAEIKLRIVWSLEPVPWVEAVRARSLKDLGRKVGKIRHDQLLYLAKILHCEPSEASVREAARSRCVVPLPGSVGKSFRGKKQSLPPRKKLSPQ